VRASEIRPVRSGFGISILSTNKGVVSDETARKENLGGEILCEVW
jgi:small subunit ribosomal protein S8